jgi:hypothetical protein
MTYKSITVKAESGAFLDIITEVGVSKCPLESSNLQPQIQSVYWTKCLWDTGASHSSITQATATILGLKPAGEARVFYGQGDVITNFYLVGLTLPHLLHIPEVRVTEFANNESFGVILGMDVICQGDFAITNLGGRSTFSFCVPSLETIDFEERIKNLQRKM